MQANGTHTGQGKGQGFYQLPIDPVFITFSQVMFSIRNIHQDYNSQIHKASSSFPILIGNMLFIK